LQAYLGERYCITVPLVLTSFGERRSHQKIFGEQRSPRSAFPLDYTTSDGRYFQIQKSPYLYNAHGTFSKFKNLLNRHLKLYLSHKTANIDGKNWPVYNQV